MAAKGGMGEGNCPEGFNFKDRESKRPFANGTCPNGFCLGVADCFPYDTIPMEVVYVGICLYIVAFLFATWFVVTKHYTLKEQGFTPGYGRDTIICTTCTFLAVCFPFDLSATQTRKVHPMPPQPLTPKYASELPFNQRASR
eukprot:TRINITY_DN59358_c0_g1_i1.p2 TRINITY_DN59358_c0_g1~~TRINITY_DN59358_c0_g1_i1.p2  ORF type:complete len:142 (+),score=3.20 TRINITY_DN59358_c0_g1_i1:65-490(+)